MDAIFRSITSFLIGLLFINSVQAFGNGRGSALQVVGGGVYKKGQYNFLVSLRSYIDDSAFCTGSVVGDYWILTANHCVVNEGKEISPKAFYIKTGRKSGEGENFTVVSMTHYPLNRYDVTLIKVKQRLTSNTVQSVPISNVSLSAGTNFTAVGWGLTSLSSRDPAKQATKLSNMVVIASCADRPRAYMICTTYPSPRTSLAPGDSGSPALLGPINSLTLAGVLSQSSQKVALYEPSNLFYSWAVSTIQTGSP